ncbi:hypothetical protein U0070_013832, partial [Myodes glareolus]
MQNGQRQETNTYRSSDDIEVTFSLDAERGSKAFWKEIRGGAKETGTKMMKIMTQEVQLNYVTEVVTSLIPDNIGKDIARACQSFYLLYNIFVSEVKMLKRPIFEMEKLMELHGEDKDFENKK